MPFEQKYFIMIRRFIEEESVLRFKGDNRKASTSMDASYRTSGSVFFNLDTGQQLTDFTGATTGTRYEGVFDFLDAEAIADVSTRGSKFEGEKGKVQISIQTSANDPLVPGSPDLDTRLTFVMEKTPDGINIQGAVDGDVYTGYEVILVGNNKTILLDSYESQGGLYSLAGNYMPWIGSFDKSYVIDENGVLGDEIHKEAFDDSPAPEYDHNVPNDSAAPEYDPDAPNDSTHPDYDEPAESPAPEFLGPTDLRVEPFPELRGDGPIVEDTISPIADPGYTPPLAKPPSTAEKPSRQGEAIDSPLDDFAQEEGYSDQSINSSATDPSDGLVSVEGDGFGDQFDTGKVEQTEQPEFNGVQPHSDSVISLNGNSKSDDEPEADFDAQAFSSPASFESGYDNDGLVSVEGDGFGEQFDTGEAHQSELKDSSQEQSFDDSSDSMDDNQRSEDEPEDEQGEDANDDSNEDDDEPEENDGQASDSSSSTGSDNNKKEEEDKQEQERQEKEEREKQEEKEREAEQEEAEGPG